jgi:hypothetical protein
VIKKEVKKMADDLKTAHWTCPHCCKIIEVKAEGEVVAMQQDTTTNKEDN